MTRARDQLTGKSDFGKGFILQLVKLAEHAERIDNIEDLQFKERVIKLWFAEAGDHLYELEIPLCFKNTKVEALVNELKNLSSPLRVGHATLEDVDRAISLVRMTIELDKYFGLIPDIGRLG